MNDPSTGWINVFISVLLPGLLIFFSVVIVFCLLSRLGILNALILWYRIPDFWSLMGLCSYFPKFIHIFSSFLKCLLIYFTYIWGWIVFIQILSTLFFEIHPFYEGQQFFPFYSWWHPIVYMKDNLFIHSPVENFWLLWIKLLYTFIYRQPLSEQNVFISLGKIARDKF